MPRRTMKSLSRLWDTESVNVARTEARGRRMEGDLPNFEKSVGVAAGDGGQRVEMRHGAMRLLCSREKWVWHNGKREGEWRP